MKVVCGADFSVILDLKGALHSFGDPEYGQLGIRFIYVLCNHAHSTYSSTIINERKVCDKLIYNMHWPH